MTAQPKAKPESKLTATEVSEWLHNNPDFFKDQPEVLESLDLQHQAQGAISLIEHQVTALRRRNTSLNTKLNELIERAKDNQRLSVQLHQLSLTLLEADTLDSVLSVAREQLDTVFDAEAVSIKLFKTGSKDKAPYYINARDISRQFSSAYRTNNCLCGTLSKEQNDLIFTEQEIEIKSSVFIPLNEGRPIGFLAMGSARKSRFTPSMGVLFIKSLGELVGRAVISHQDMQEQ